MILKEIINKDIKYIVEHIRFLRTDNGFQAALAGCPLGLGRDESEGPGAKLKKFKLPIVLVKFSNEMEGVKWFL